MTPLRALVPTLLALLMLAPLAVAAASPGTVQETTTQDGPLAPAAWTLRARGEAPFAVAALMVPTPGEHPLARVLLAALLDEPGAIEGGPWAAFEAEGGRLSAALEPGGLLLVAEGPFEALPAAVEALLGFGEGALSMAHLPHARARALRRRALDAADAGLLAEDALWRAAFGEGAPQASFTADELELVRAPLGALEAERAALARAPGQSLHLEGRLADAVVADVQARLGPAQARPLLEVAPGGTARDLSLGGATPRLWLAQPLPPWPELRGPFGAALLAAITPATVPHGATASLAFRPGGCLLLLELPAQGDSAEAQTVRLAAALGALRQAPPAEADLDGLLRAAAAAEARSLAVIGAGAREDAQRSLLFGAAPEGPKTAAALREFLWLALAPEALRAVLVTPAAP